MKNVFFMAAWSVLFTSLGAMADSASNSDLYEKMNRLESRVKRLEERLDNLATSKQQGWVCKVKNFSQGMPLYYLGAASTKAEAKLKALDACKNAGKTCSEYPDCSIEE